MHHLYEIYGSSPSREQSLLDGCDVRLRLMVALTAIAAVLLSTQLWFGLAAAGLCLAGLLAVRVPLGVIAGRFAAPLGLAFLLGLVQLFATTGTPWFEMDLGVGRLTATWEGFRHGILLGSRVAGSVSLAVTACLGVPATDLFAALRWAKVPRTWIEIAALMYRYIFTFFEQAVSIALAQKVRLGYTSAGRSYRSLGCLAGMVVLRSLDQADKSHEAMVARAYQGRLPLPHLPGLTSRQWKVGLAGVIGVGLLYLLAERWPL